MAENPITIQFTYSADDYAEGSRAASVYFTPSKNRVPGSAAYALTAAGVTGGPWIILSNVGDRSALLVGSAVFGLGLWYSYALCVHFWRVHFGRKREFLQIEILQGNREMQFNEANIARWPRSLPSSNICACALTPFHAGSAEQLK